MGIVNPNQNLNSGAPTPSTGNSSNYDFILSPQKQKRPMFSSGGLSPAVKILIGSLTLLFIFILIMIVKNSLTPKQFSASNITSVVLHQQRMINIINLDLENNKNQLSAANLNSMYSIDVVVQSDQGLTLSYLGKNGVGLTKAQLNMVNTASVDTSLKDAATSGTLDQTYVDVLGSELNTYLNTLGNAYQTTHGKNGRTLLKQEILNAKALIKQLGSK